MAPSPEPLTPAHPPTKLGNNNPIAMDSAPRSRRRRFLGGLLSLLVMGAAAPVQAAEVMAESTIDQASARRDASSKVPAKARILSSHCSEVALPGLSFRYRCSVQYEPAPAAPQGPASPTAIP